MILKVINNLLGKKWFPVSFRMITLAAFWGLVIIGFASPTDNIVFMTQLGKTNLTTSFVWRLWWPLVVLSAIFFGRIWCMVCPMEMVTTFFAKIGFKQKRPGWILSGWVITLFYFVILTAGITILEIDTIPRYTSYYLLTLMGVAIISGLVFKKNTFCRYICPVGYLLTFFSKMAIWGWRVKDKSVCYSCPDKSCVKNKYIYQLNSKSCGVDLVPSNINDNNYCLLCGGCLRTCKKYKTDNNSLRPNPVMVKIGFANDLMQIKPIRSAEWVFLFFLTGSMIFEMTHFQIVTAIDTSFIQKNTSAIIGRDLIHIIYLYFLLPVLLWALPYWLLKLSRIRISLNNYLKKVSNVFLPVIAFFFVGLSFMEIVSKFPFYKHIVRDVKGVETIKAILFRQIEVPQFPSWTEWAFSIILILVLIFGIIISFKVIREFLLKLDIRKNGKLIYFFPAIFIIMVYLEGIAYQIFLAYYGFV